jgi:hypothetical protein
MAGQQIDLAQIFQEVTNALQQNQGALNKADNYNHDHGTNMVNTFNTITQALQQKQGAHPADQLAYASQMVQQNSTSASGQMIANGLQQAAQHFTGKSFNIESVLPLIQMLLGGGQASVSGGSSNILGSFLGSLGGSQSGQGLDLTQILAAGAGLLGGGQSGSGSNVLGSLVGSLVNGSQMADNTHHTQSGQIVANSILQSLSKMLGQ